MKFGKRLEDDLAEPRWEEHYVRYRVLKKMIKVLSLLGKDANEQLLEETLMLFPRKKKKKLLRGLRDTEVNCTVCKRWNLFSSILLEDVAHVRGFLSSTVHGLQVSFYNNIHPQVAALLNDIRMGGEPRLYPGSKETILLARFAVFLDTLEALRRFVVVNDMAMVKVIKKFKKRVLSSVDVDAPACCEQCAKHMLKRRAFSLEHLLKSSMGSSDVEPDEEADLYSSSDDEAMGRLKTQSAPSSKVEGFADTQIPQEGCIKTAASEVVLSQKPFLRKLENECSSECDTIAKLEAAAETLLSRTMVSSSVYHDFIVDQQTQLQGQRQQEKLARVEARAKMLTRLTRHIDMENQVRPATFLLVGVILPLLTLVATYYVSSTIYIDEKKSMTIFDEKGFFISASLDVAPASNIGTLGLTTTLMMLSVIIFVKHKLVKKQLRGRQWMRTHRIATAFGMMSLFCGNGVAAFQHNANATAHNTFAALFFVFGMIHVVLETMLDLMFSLSMPFTRKARVTIAIVLIISVLGFLGPMSYVLVHEPPPDVLRYYKHVAACFEITAFACFVLWFGSYYSIMKASQFKLHVVHRVRLDSSEDLTNLRFSHHIHRRQNSMDSLESFDSDLGSAEDNSPKMLSFEDAVAEQEARAHASSIDASYVSDDDDDDDDDDEDENDEDTAAGNRFFKRQRSIVHVESNPRMGLDLDDIAFHEARQNSGKLKAM